MSQRRAKIVPWAADPPVSRMAVDLATAAASAELLTPYVPRLLIDWLRTSPSEQYHEIEGSLAFVDISGFTKMTERLARRGKVGAEEMSDLLNTCFTQLLRLAELDGADLVKWG